MPKRSGVGDLTLHARFVFQGTVQKLKAATMPEVPVNERTAIVTVEKVIEAPEALSHYAGQEITVQLAGKQILAKGQQAMFYTNGWLFGESVAVQSVDQRPAEIGRASLAAMDSDPVANLAGRDSRMRFDGADVVVSGRVVSVSLPAGTPPMMAMSGVDLTTADPLSEHAPLWRDAVIEVDAVHKGTHSGKRAVVRFPASTDVMWHKAPKFQAGQEGFFLLHTGELKASERRGFAMAAAPEEGAYTALHPADFQPFDRATAIQDMISASPSSKDSPDR